MKNKFEIRYATSIGLKDGRIKSVYTNDEEQANRMFERVRRFAENHNLSMTVALWKNKWLVKSCKIGMGAV